MPSDLPSDAQTRLARVIDQEGGRRLSTPRAVVRALNAVSFSYSALAGKIDYPDLVWLQLVRTGNPDLYRWIERYVGNVSAIISSSSSMASEEVEIARREIEKIADNERRSLESVLDSLSDQLLGIGVTDKSLYNDISREQWSSHLLASRLSSPEHYRLFFALQQPALSSTIDELNDFAAALDASAEDVADILIGWSSMRDGSGASKAEAFLERFTEDRVSQLNQSQSLRLAVGLGHCVDSIVSKADDVSWWGPRVGRRAAQLLKEILRNNDASRWDIVRDVFSQGRSISWLTMMFRNEYFAQGRFGDQRRHESEWMLNSEELNTVSEIMISRYEKSDPIELESQKDAGNIMYAWYQANEDSFRSRVIEPALVDDDRFLGLLETVKSQVRSSSGDYWKISRQAVSAWFPFEEVIARLSALSTQGEGQRSAKAAQLLGFAQRDR